MKLGYGKGIATSSLFLLLAVPSCIFFSARPASAQCSDATATRPILFVPGIWEDSTKWGPNVDDFIVSGIRHNVITQLANTPGYSNTEAYDLYFDGITVRWAQPPPGRPLTDPIASSANIPCTARNFAISFYGWPESGQEAFDPGVVSGVSILTKAYELSQVLQAIAGLTYVQDSIVIAHSMGALDTRVYLDGLAPLNTTITLGTPAIVACKQLKCPMPSTIPYTGEVGHLITLDGTNAGADLAYFNDALSGIFGLNVSELQPSSAVVQALNNGAGYLDQLGDDRHAHSPNPAPTIDAIIDYFSPSVFNPFSTAPCALNWLDSCTWDLVVPYDSQSIRDPLSDLPGLNDIAISFSAADLSISLDPNCTFVPPGLPVPFPIPGVLHLLPCLGDYHPTANPGQTSDYVVGQTYLNTAGQPTTVNVKTTYDGGAQYSGPISLILSYGDTPPTPPDRGPG